MISDVHHGSGVNWGLGWSLAARAWLVVYHCNAEHGVEQSIVVKLRVSIAFHNAKREEFDETIEIRALFSLLGILPKCLGLRAAGNRTALIGPVVEAMSPWRPSHQNLNGGLSLSKSRPNCFYELSLPHSSSKTIAQRMPCTSSMFT